jgi:hypothetical protein
MIKLEDAESSNDRRLVLGFDGGCLSCSMLAKRIKEQVGDKLEVKNLRDPQLQGWRKAVLGENAPWAPTLFEVNGASVRAWTGLRMGLVLTRSLGPADTWRVMQAIGEMRPTKEKLVPGSFSRGQFLTGVSGAALAITMLSSAGKFASPAAAHGNHRELKGADLVDKARRYALSEDVINVAGSDWAARMQTGQVVRRCLPKGDCEIAIGTGDSCQLELVERNTKFDTKGYCTVPTVVKHVNFGSSNNSMLAISWAVPSSNRLIIYRQYDKPVHSPRGNFKIATIAKLFKRGPDGTKLKLTSISINGKERKLRNWT